MVTVIVSETVHEADNALKPFSKLQLCHFWTDVSVWTKRVVRGACIVLEGRTLLRVRPKDDLAVLVVCPRPCTKTLTPTPHRHSCYPQPKAV